MIKPPPAIQSRPGDQHATDADLLANFVAQRDHRSFEILVGRYGPMVLSVCRKLLRDAQDAEDACQATFLLLARKAPSIGRRELLPMWLHKVAFRVAIRAREKKNRNHSVQPLQDVVPAPPSSDALEQQDLQTALAEELERLPRKLRTPLVLCYLQGYTNQEAAAQIGCSLGTVVYRLAQGRERLRGRLVRRGLLLSAAALAAALTGSTEAAMPLALTQATAHAATAVVGGSSLTGAASASAVLLAQETVKSLAIAKAGLAAAMVVGVSVAAMATSFVVHSMSARAPVIAASPTRRVVVPPVASLPALPHSRSAAPTAKPADTNVAPSASSEATRPQPTRPATPAPIGTPPAATPPAAERCIAAALRWIVRHQSPDGHWSLLELQRQCKDKTCTGRPNQAFVHADAAATALALLPLLGAGHSARREGPYRDAIQAGLAWLMSQQQPDGNLAPGAFKYLYCQALATIALCEADRRESDARLHATAQRAVNFIVDEQNPRTGGWKYLRGDEGDTCVLGWQIAALHSAVAAGLKVNPATMAAANHWLDSCAQGPQNSLFSYMPGDAPRAGTTAIGLRSRELLGLAADSPTVRAGVRYLVDHPPDRAVELCYLYYGSQVTQSVLETEGDAWRQRLQDLLVRAQNADATSCACGSWILEKDPWCHNAGRLFTTSLATQILEIPAQRLSIFR